MNCIIVDDEELAHQVIIEFASRLPFITIVERCYNAQEAFVALQSHNVDLIFLDIRMPSISGLEFLKSSTRLPHVIMTTAYEDSAVQGFEMDVIDYLLKPYPFERFLKAVNKSYNLQNQKNILQAKNQQLLQDSFIFVRANNQDVKLKLNEIVRISALKDYIMIYTMTEKLIVHLTMKAIFDKIKTDNFIRVHNSHIISLQHLQSVGKNTLTIDNERIPISEKYKPYLSSIIDQFK